MCYCRREESISVSLLKSFILRLQGGVESSVATLSLVFWLCGFPCLRRLSSGSLVPSQLSPQNLE